MCGIFAYLNYLVLRDRRHILETLLQGLRRLEYRGYDSAGLSIDDDSRRLLSGMYCRKNGFPAFDAVPLIFKEEGKIEKLVSHVYEEVRALNLDLDYQYDSHAGIAHTRWATHGPPSPENSHPLSSGEGNEFLVVHNGIITNYQVLKQTLLRHGFEFESDTDTEVIPKLAKYVFDQFTHGQGHKFVGGNFEDGEEKVSFRQIVMEVMRQLEGAYALIFKSVHYPNELVACKRGSPMLLGVRDPCEAADRITMDGVAGVQNGHSVSPAEANGNHAERGMNGFASNGRRAENGVHCRSGKVDNGPVSVTENGCGMQNGGGTMCNGNGEVLVESDDDDYREENGVVLEENGMEAGTKGCGGRKIVDDSQAMKLWKLDGGPKEFFIASDASALVEHTRKVMVIEDNEVVHLKNGRLALFRFDCDTRNGFARPASVERALSTLEMEFEQIMKGPYEHYMQKEIFEQPESLTTTMRGRVIPAGHGKVKGVVLGGLKDYLSMIRKSRRIIFIGCGTSFHAALASRPLMEELSGLPVAMELASDLIDRQCPIFREDTAVFVSQSGETADTLLALEYAKSRGALCVGITNTVGSAIARNTDCGVHINAGCEIGVASTKAYTSQILVMTMMALALGEDSISNRKRREDIIDDLQKLPDKVREVLTLDEDMKALAKELMIEQSLLVFGRGYNYATALEGALKVKEVALMHSEGILAGEMKHGPLALVDETMPIIVIATRDSTWSKQQSVIQQLQARSGRLIVMCTKGDASVMCPNGGARIIEVPQLQDCLQSIINIVPLQILSYHLTVLRGYNVDQPRNLAKSVTTL